MSGEEATILTAADGSCEAIKCFDLQRALPFLAMAIVSPRGSEVTRIRKSKYIVLQKMTRPNKLGKHSLDPPQILAIHSALVGEPRY
mmetsp:Transcript_1149/g.3180  ORF Transcript_1149/g.3180 Transcript_1149/m.3180 type:complete len:87 (-) Transcript_1149:314-574(-)